MHEEYHRWPSPSLGREMEMLVFGHAGEPVLVFPTSMWRYFAFRHPALVNKIVALGGDYDIHGRLDGYYDDECYYNCPVDFIPNINDHALLEQMRRMGIYLVAGEADFCLAGTKRLAGILSRK